MSDHPHRHPPFDAEKRVAASRGALIATVVHLWPYIWPSDRRDLKWRVFAAMALLLAAKLATIAVPFTFKWATDALAGQGSAPLAASDWLLWALAAPIVMTVAYGGMRILMAALTESHVARWRCDAARPPLTYVRPRLERAATFRVDRVRAYADAGYDAAQAALAALAGPR